MAMSLPDSVCFFPATVSEAAHSPASVPIPCRQDLVNECGQRLMLLRTSTNHAMLKIQLSSILRNVRAPEAPMVSRNYRLVCAYIHIIPFSTVPQGSSLLNKPSHSLRQTRAICA